MIKEKFDVYQMVTDRVCEAIEQGRNPWQKTWAGANAKPQNFFSKRPYRGINYILCALGYSDLPYFATYKQIQEHGGHVKKGSKAIPLVYSKPYWKDANGRNFYEKDLEGKPEAEVANLEKRYSTRYYKVFNLSDTEGIGYRLEEFQLQAHEMLSNCEAVVAGYQNKPVIHTGVGKRPVYKLIPDEVNCPDIGQYVSSEAYYNDLFHELVHSTGHETRLNRKGFADPTEMDNKAYAYEELIAEIGAAFLCNHTGIDTEAVQKNSESYLVDWIQEFQNDKRMIVTAARQAQKAVDYIIVDSP